jgi:hypothetical protein
MISLFERSGINEVARLDPGGCAPPPATFGFRPRSSFFSSERFLRGALPRKDHG